MIILEILKYTLPSVVVFLTAYFILKQQTEKELLKEDRDDAKERRVQTNETLLPIKLQAYERLTLFMERIHPHQLILRNSQPGLNSMQFQAILMKSVRDEFEHNLSQQLYVSEKAWAKVQNAKEECIKQINYASSKLNSESNATELGSLIIQLYAQLSPSPIQEAIKQLKMDIHKGL